MTYHEAIDNIVRKFCDLEITEITESIEGFSDIATYHLIKHNQENSIKSYFTKTREHLFAYPYIILKTKLKYELLSQAVYMNLEKNKALQARVNTAYDAYIYDDKPTIWESMQRELVDYISETKKGIEDKYTFLKYNKKIINDENKDLEIYQYLEAIIGTSNLFNEKYKFNYQFKMFGNRILLNKMLKDINTNTYRMSEVINKYNDELNKKVVNSTTNNDNLIKLGEELNSTYSNYNKLINKYNDRFVIDNDYQKYLNNIELRNQVWADINNDYDNLESYYQKQYQLNKDAKIIGPNLINILED